MNVFINIVCVSLITFVNAGDVNYDTILTILKQTGDGAERRINLLNADGKNETVETMPVIPGFYLQKPKEISSTLFRNPTDWPDALFSNLKSKNNSQTGGSVKKNITRDGYLDAKILKAIKNLNKYKESQKTYNNKLGIWKSNSNDDNVQNAPVKVLLGHVLNSIKNEDIAKKKLKTQKHNEKLKNDKILKQILTGIKDNNRYEKKEKRKKVKKTDYDYKKAKLETLLRNLLKMKKTNSEDEASSESSETSEEDSYAKETKKDGNVLEDILNALNSNNNVKSIEKSQPIVLIQSEPSNVLRANALSEHIASFRYGLPNSTAFHNNDRSTRHKSSLVAFQVDYENHDPDYMYTRKSGGSSKVKANDGSGDTDASDEEELEKNPGNPFTIHKNKYKQNWPYNHYMDGDHMNINPMGPKFGNLGPSGPELFFGRKWWYYNQDDYKPMG